MTTPAATAASPALSAACAALGLTAEDAVAIRLAENEIWRLPGGAVARIARAGQWEATVREVRIARWLTQHGVPAVRLLETDQPVLAHDRPVSYWEELPAHEHGTLMDLVQLLLQLHSTLMPDFLLGRLQPFVRVRERIDAATSLSKDDRHWLRDLTNDLEQRWKHLPPGLAECVIHGDAWVGNVAKTAGGPVFLDLERFAVGPPEWDLVSTAVKMTTTGAVSREEYAEFCDAYGADVTEWAGYETLRATRELRMTTYAAQHAATRPEWQPQAQHRVDCLRGRNGPRPWKWMGIL
ncbi:phosphotransferase [Streptomyces sp. NPDC052042]|uniref:phosphotransferase n=1 Tax=Streptomyces sp. NPDC052042 TaxID=3365683 RepID=UPI0037D6822F